MGWLAGLLQLTGAGAIAAGLIALLGWAWAAVVLGAMILAVGVRLEQHAPVVVARAR